MTITIGSPAWRAVIDRLPDGPHAAVEVTYTNSVHQPAEAYVRVVMCRREPACPGGHFVLWSKRPTLDAACEDILPQFDGFRYWGDR